MRKTAVWGPGLVPAASPLAASTRLHMEKGTEMLGFPIQSPLYASAVEAHLRKLGAKFSHTCSTVGGLADTQSAHAHMRNCLGPANVQYALRTLPLRHTAAFTENITVTQQATWNTVVVAPASAAHGCRPPCPLARAVLAWPVLRMWPRWRGLRETCSSSPERSQCWIATGNWSSH